MRYCFMYFFIITSLIANQPSAAQTVTNGLNGSASIKSTVVFRNFNSGGGQEVHLGNGNLSSMVNINDVNWSNGRQIKFIYNAAAGTLTAEVLSTPAKSVVFNCGNLGSINYLDFEIVGGQSSAGVSLNSIKINANLITPSDYTAPANKYFNITGLNLTSFAVGGNIVLTGSQPGGDGNYIKIRAGYLTPPDQTAPVILNLAVNPDYSEVGTNIVVSGTADDSNTGNSNITSVEYSLDGSLWNPVSGTFDSPVEEFSFNLTGLQCGNYTVYVRAKDALNNLSDPVNTQFVVYEKGSISGKILVNNAGVGGVIVKLLSLDGNTVSEINSLMSSPDSPAGYYEFTDLEPDDYRIMIVLPIGYTTQEELKDITIGFCNNDITENFSLEAVAIANNARSKGYWKHQFDVYITGKGKAQETSTSLNSFVGKIVSNYISHYDLIFNANYSFQYWSDLLSYGGPDMYRKAAGQLSALVLNMASLKIAQSEIVTLDNRDVADVITCASEILSDPNSTAALLETAKEICEYVNTQKTIPAGIVPDYNILYKQNSKSELPVEYALNNYPNPFNPSTVIKYSLPEASDISLKLYDVLGNVVTSLFEGRKEAGYYKADFNAAGLSSGIYLCILKGNNIYKATKIMLLK